MNLNDCVQIRINCVAPGTIVGHGMLNYDAAVLEQVVTDYHWRVRSIDASIKIAHRIHPADWGLKAKLPPPSCFCSVPPPPTSTARPSTLTADPR
jgi:hypothetical protein